MFRLYNASFKRLPDPDGLRYWIGNFSSGKDDERAVASSFLVSEEFKQRYGENVTNAKYVQTLYVNVLGRDYDQVGYNYWLANLNNGVIDSKFIVPWENFKNTLMVTNSDGLNKISTRIYKIISVE